MKGAGYRRCFQIKTNKVATAVGEGKNPLGVCVGFLQAQKAKINERFCFVLIFDTMAMRHLPEKRLVLGNDDRKHLG